MNNKWRLDNRRALITGGTKGIGRATAGEMMELGAEVFITARTKKDIEQRLEDWNKEGYKAYGFACDVSSEEERQKLFAEVNKVWDSFDILVNNVGTNIRKRTEEYDIEEYRRIVETNMTSLFQVSRESYPFLKKKGGSIVNISSVAGLTHMRTGSPYAMTKAAINQFTKNLAAEWAADDIRVNAIAPWYIDTPLVQPVLNNEEYMKEVLERTPMKRVGKPEEVAAAAAFFCMEGAGYITGQCISVDGGFMIYGF